MPGQDAASKAARSRVQKLALTITEPMLTNAANGGAQTIELGKVPAGAEILGVAFRLNTQFTGGAASAVGLTLGDSISATRLGSGMDLFGGAAGGSFIRPTTPGLGAGPYAAESAINAIITPDGAHSLVNLTAGSVDIDIMFAVP